MARAGFPGGPVVLNGLAGFVGGLLIGGVHQRVLDHAGDLDLLAPWPDGHDPGQLAPGDVDALPSCASLNTPGGHVVADGDQVAEGGDQALHLGAEGNEPPPVAVGRSDVFALAHGLGLAGAVWCAQCDVQRLVSGVLHRTFWRVGAWPGDGLADLVDVYRQCDYRAGWWCHCPVGSELDPLDWFGVYRAGCHDVGAGTAAVCRDLVTSERIGAPASFVAVGFAFHQQYRQINFGRQG